jgi:dienelactone hydrolase
MKKIFILMAALAIQQGIYAQTLKPVAYQDGAQKLNGLVTSNAAASKDGKKLSGVLILPAWKGIDDEAKNAALDLEKQGYIAFVADIYGEGNIPTDNASAMAIAGKFKNDYALYQRRIELALQQLQAVSNSKKIAVIGYCFGGTGALETARASFPVKGVVSIHGGLNKSAERKNGALNTKILIENPAEDQSVTPQIMNDLITEMNEGKADWQIITYAYSKHTFTDPKSPDYNEIMAKRAWKHTLVFLKEVLK